MGNVRYTKKIFVFHGRQAPEEGFLVGYAALIEFYNLQMPFPDMLTLISKKNKNYEVPGWRVMGPRYAPEENLKEYLAFALKYEGIDLLFFKKLFQKIEQNEIVRIILSEYTSQYNRRIWFLYEWLMQKKLPIVDLKIKNFIPLIDPKLQYASPVSINSSRHRIKNNLPGTVDFCPLIRKTTKLENYIKENLKQRINSVISGVHKDILLRTSAFLLLRDSKASFTIEGEAPSQSRAARWGRAIGQSGTRPLSKEELLRLQQIVIENDRFTKMGFRTEGGFVGEHDRSTGEPIPEHISSRWQDIDNLVSGLLKASYLMEATGFHPILNATKIAFGFVFIHPFSDGNGRLHRYLIHHLLAKTNFAPQGIIFPVSAAMLENIEDYRKVLESYSHPLLDFIEWKKTASNNVEVLNDTSDFYRYFDATIQAEFLFGCVEYTINKIIPQEVRYLQNYDEMKTWLDDTFQMPDSTVALLIRFLEQNKGVLSKRAREKEFAVLTDQEIQQIESYFKKLFREEKDKVKENKPVIEELSAVERLEKMKDLHKNGGSQLKITFRKNPKR